MKKSFTRELTDKLPGVISTHSMRLLMQTIRILTESIARLLGMVRGLPTREEVASRREVLSHHATVLSQQTAMIRQLTNLEQAVRKLMQERNEALAGAKISANASATNSRHVARLMEESAYFRNHMQASMEANRRDLDKILNVTEEFQERSQMTAGILLSSQLLGGPSPGMKVTGLQEVARGLPAALNKQRFQDEAELMLLAALAKHLQHRSLIDIGANRGQYIEFFRMLDFPVWAFEPDPMLAALLSSRYAGEEKISILGQAVSNAAGTAKLHGVKGGTDQNLSLYNSLITHALPESWEFDEGVAVPTITLHEAHQQGRLPEEAGILKIDTEGGELEVIAGMDRARYEVIQMEFWQQGHVFADASTLEKTHEAIRLLGKLGYRQTGALQRPDGSSVAEWKPAFADCSLASWGNLIFARDEAMAAICRKLTQEMLETPRD